MLSSRNHIFLKTWNKFRPPEVIWSSTVISENSQIVAFSHHCGNLILFSHCSSQTLGSTGLCFKHHYIMTDLILCLKHNCVLLLRIPTSLLKVSQFKMKLIVMQQLSVVLVALCVRNERLFELQMGLFVTFLGCVHTTWAAHYQLFNSFLAQ